jgi:hypothetical protein
MTPSLDPAASIEVTTTQRLRARVRVDAHPAMDELTVLTFTAENGTRVEMALSPDNLARLGQHISDRLAAVTPTTLQGVSA